MKYQLFRLFCDCFAIVLLICVCGQTSELQGSDAQPLMSDPELLKGVDAYMRGDYDACYKLFRGVYEKNPSLSPPGVLMAQLFSSDGKYVKMHEYLEKASLDHPTDPEIFFQLGQIALKEGRRVECRLLMDKGNAVLEQLEKSGQGKNKAFSSRLDELFRQSYSLQANLAQSENDFAAAEESIRKITLRNRNDADAWTSLGFLLFKQNKNEEALKAFAQAQTLDPSLSADWLVLAQLLHHEGKTDEAKQLVDTQFDQEKTTPGDLARLVRLFAHWGRFKEAEKLTGSLLKKNANSLAAWTLLGELSLYQSEFAVAEDQFRKAVLINSSDFDATNGLALALSDQQNRQKLIQAHTIAKTNWEHNPKLPEAIATYAWILYLLGQRDQAEQLFSPMLEKGEITSTIAYYLAEIANSRRASPLALNFLDLALEKEAWFPKRAAAIELRQLLEKKK